MIEPTTLARPYARAAFEHAKQQGTVDTWSEALTALAAVSAEANVETVLSDPSLTGDQRAQVLASLLGDALPAPAMNFLRVLAENGRLDLLSDVAALFDQFKQALEATVAVDITSAFDLSTEQGDALAADIAAKLQRAVTVTTHTDASLMGGAIIRAGDLVIDGSVRGRLNKLAGTLTP